MRRPYRAAAWRQGIDVLPVQLVTAGSKIDEFTSKLFAGNHYRDYYELNGLVMQLTEALAEFWHARIRSELGLAAEEPKDKAGLFKLDYRGARFSLGYPACLTWRTAARCRSC